MTKEHQVVLSLIRKAVNPDVEIHVPLDMNWRKVIEFASTQGVLGLCFEAIEKVAPEQRPDMDNLMDMLGQVEYMSTMYEEHRKAISDLAEFYECQQIKIMLLKGYGLSLYWPVPKHRPVGDIDIYLFEEGKECKDGKESRNGKECRDGKECKEDDKTEKDLSIRSLPSIPLYQRADRLISEKLGIEVESGHEHHTTFTFRGTSTELCTSVMVENHYDFINVKAHKDARHIEGKLKELVSNGYRKVLIGSNGKESKEGKVITSEQSELSVHSEPSILLPSANFNVIFLIRHMGQHFAGERVTLRQLLDVLFFLKAEGKNVHWYEVIPFLKEMSIWTFFNQICAIGEDYFSMKVPLGFEIERKEDLEKRILQDILHPEFTEEKPQGLMPVLWFKARRWWYNRWKHPLVYNEWWLPMLLTLVWSHLRRFDTIKD